MAGKEKKFELVELTFINEKEERITCNIRTGEVTPETISPESKATALIRAGAFIAGGNACVKNLWS